MLCKISRNCRLSLLEISLLKIFLEDNLITGMPRLYPLLKIKNLFATRPANEITAFPPRFPTPFLLNCLTFLLQYQ